jgi:DNA-binding MarR family transcriptional regulator
MSITVNFARVERRSRATVLARDSANRHDYFVAVAHARYILRKVFRLIEDKARQLGIEALEHQALLQVYGSPSQELRVSELAERLDIAAAFASNLVKGLVKRKLLKRESDLSDRRVTVLRITNAGRDLCHRVDTEVRPHVEYFTSQLTSNEREIALATLMFYIGPHATGVRGT